MSFTLNADLALSHIEVIDAFEPVENHQSAQSQPPSNLSTTEIDGSPSPITHQTLIENPVQVSQVSQRPVPYAATLQRHPYRKMLDEAQALHILLRTLPREISMIVSAPLTTEKNMAIFTTAHKKQTKAVAIPKQQEKKPPKPFLGHYGNCMIFGHEVKNFVGPIDDEGFISACPVCNTNCHVLGKCVKSRKTMRKQLLSQFTIQRVNKPPLRFEFDYRKVESWERRKDEGNPWTLRFALDFHKENTDFWQTFHRNGQIQIQRKIEGEDSMRKSGKKMAGSVPQLGNDASAEELDENIQTPVLQFSPNEVSKPIKVEVKVEEGDIPAPRTREMSIQILKDKVQTLVRELLSSGVPEPIKVEVKIEEKYIPSTGTQKDTRIQDLKDKVQTLARELSTTDCRGKSRQRSRSASPRRKYENLIPSRRERSPMRERKENVLPLQEIKSNRDEAQDFLDILEREMNSAFPRTSF
ncbi:hypothetical protein G7Y89_g8980 [Cudoniella acicularis]|uniref:Uncharacterized protein n=1 Tax=Cudoniella acicularis TaxID=354080 RepID=A0A8H4RHU6_9HELO|nr:hypothetical protein G7Y89_g8980 [Cudoniella acicularis]